ncbi:MAG TPA: serine/threonine-protein kinase, partial [Ktedonobacteraceae bacterium]
MLAGLQHPNLPSIHDYFNQNGRSYLVMSFIEGETLEHYLETTSNSYLTIKEVLEIGIQLCTALDFLHTRTPPIIFRDLKPSNIMRTPNGHIYLIDFGIVRHFKPGQTRDTNALGTLGYAAPEQYGKAQTTPRADIYSLGATLHYLLSGNDPINTPFRFTPLHFQDQPELLDLEMLVMQMVDMDESRRPGSIAAIKQELQRIAAQEGEYKASFYRNPTTSPMAVIRTPRPVSLPHQLTAVPEQATAAPPYSGNNINTFRNFWPVHAVAWSLDGTLIASASSNVQLWEVTTGKTVFTYRGHAKAVNAVAWSPDKTTSTPGRGYRIASCSDDKTVQVWNAATGNNIATYTGHAHLLRGGSVKAIAWSPDGTLIASAGQDRTVQVWHVATGGDVYTYQGHAHWLKGGSVNTLAWSPDGQLIASGSDDKSLQVWEAISGAYIFTYRGNSTEVHTVAWSPDSKRIASGDNAGRVRIWDAATGTIIYTYSAHNAPVRSIDWSPDNKHIASASD